MGKNRPRNFRVDKFYQIKICFLTHNIWPDNGGGVLSFKIIEGIRSFFGADAYVLTGLPSGQKYEKTMLSNSATILKNFFRIRKIFKECDLIPAMDIFLNRKKFFNIEAEFDSI